MGKICRIAVSLVATGAMLWSGLLQQLVYAEDHAGVVTAQNDYIQYSVKADNGRFSIKNVLGDPYRPTDNDAALLYKEEEPETSFATFKIDGKDYIYGNAYGFMNLDGSFTEKPHNVDRTNTSVWSMDGVSIRQTLEIADDIKNPNIGNVRVKYEVSNNGSAVRQIGARMLLDTMLGSNDGAAFLVGGDNKPITTETSLSGDQVPTYWRSLDNLFNPAVFSYGLLSGYGNAKPSQVVFGHWNKLSETKWDYSPDANLDFTKKTNAYGAADSAVALYWNPIEIGAGETKTFETYYGTGNFSKPADGANFGLAAYAPDQLNVNEAGDGYAENEFEITAEVDNTRANNRMLSNVKASLILENGLAAVQDGTLYQTAPLIQTNGTYAFKWKVKADPQQSYAVKQYRVEIQAEGMTAPVTAGGYILLPGVHRDPPAVQYQKLAPDTVYTSGTRFITVKGQGFNVYKDLSRWSVRLENTVTGVRTELPADAADVTSDTDMMLRVEAPLDPGVYQAVITHRDFGEQRIQQTLNVSADTRYMGRYYGLLAVKKTAVDDDFIYDIVSLADEAALEQYKAGLSEDESILLDVRGEVMEKKDDSGATEYVVNTTANPAVLNSVVEYGGTPMTIRKNPHDSSHIRDYIEVSGNGSLRISGGMEFWKYEFAMEFKDGEDYALDADDDQSPVSMELAGLGKSLKMISGFGIEINGAVLHDKAVSFSGAMALTFLPGGEEKYKEEKDKKWNKQNPEYEPGSVDDSMFDFSASIDNVLFGEKENSEVGFIGIDTTVSIGLPEDFLGGMMKNEASASLTINTIDNIYGVDAQLKIKVLEFHGILTIAIQDGTPKVDDLFLSAKGEPGIMVAPDVFVTMLGGGVEDVSSISDGPGKIVLAAAIKMAEVLEGEFTLKVSRLGFSLEGGFEIAKLPFMKEVSADVQWAEPAKLELEAKLNIVDVVIGEVYIYISGERFEGYAKAAVVFPKWIPIAGGKTLAGAELGVSSESVWGSVEVIGLPVGVRYYWGQGVEFADAQGIVPIRTREGLYTERLKTEDGKPVTMVVGGNFKRITSDNNLPLQRQVASLSNADIAGLLEQTPSGTEKTQHTVAIGDQALACFEINYSGTQPQLHVYRPDGSEYVLIPEGQPNSNYLQQTVPAENSASGETEQKLFISVQAPASGNWQIVADKPVSLVGYDVTPAPKLESVQVSKVDDRQLQVDWTASNAAQSRLTVSLARNQEEAGVTIASGVNPTAGTMLASVPEDTKSGTYYIRVSLSDGQTGQQSIYSEPIRLDDPNAPLPAEGVKAALFGDGKLDVSWTGSKSAEVTGYYVEVYDEQGSKVDTVGEKFVAADESGAIIGGQYRTDKGATLGLPPGHLLQGGIDYRTEDGGWCASLQ
ncbi:hypothetical protein ACHHV8_29225 [Paenibacillus sp. TAB 01]|uniref:hypothetical protein n=1 Tax=Paenibacillus sp. TAB 01 TaxID=3368988 RepID=UPI003750025D